MSLERIVKRNKEKEKLKNIKMTYGKKPKGICPYCHNKTLFMKNEKEEIFCIRCNKQIIK